MKNNLSHLGEFKCNDNNASYGFVLNKINMLTFYLNDGRIITCDGIL